MDHLALLNGAKACDGFTKLLLAAAGNTGNTQDLTAADVEIHIADGNRTLVVADGNIPQLQKRTGLVHDRPVNVQIHLMAHHPFRQCLLVGVGCIDGGDILTLAQNRHPVRNVHNLIELMGNDDDGVALILHPAQHPEELVDFLHRQNCGGLIENDDPGAVVQHLDDLQGLLFGYGHIINFLSGIDLEAELFCHGFDLGIAVLFQRQTGLFLAHPDIVCSGKHIHQLEVLMHHADTQFLGIFRRIDGYLFPVHKNLTAVRLVNTGKHVHQCCLAGTIFAKQSQNFTGLDIQLHIFIGHHAAEGLCNSLQLDGILLCHGLFLLFYPISFQRHETENPASFLFPAFDAKPGRPMAGPVNIRSSQ